MLIAEQQSPFDNQDFLYEIKLDGIRCIAYVEPDNLILQNKRGMNLTSLFPELKQGYKIYCKKCILDGEIIVYRDGKTDFYAIQRRVMMTDKFKIHLASVDAPASFVAFDILYLDGEQITNLPLIERKKLLRKTVRDTKLFAVSQYIENAGCALFEQTKLFALEGVVAKRLNSKYYYDRRTQDWIKFKHLADDDFVVCGYIEKEKGITSIVLGQYDNSQFVYKGHVTLGINREELI